MLTRGPHFNLIFNLFSIKDTARRGGRGGQHQETAAEPGDEADAPGERGYKADTRADHRAALSAVDHLPGRDIWLGRYLGKVLGCHAKHESHSTMCI